MGFLLDGGESADSKKDPTVASRPAKPLSPEDLVHYLIELQTFAGAWEYLPSLMTTLACSLFLDEAMLLQEVDATTEKKLFTTALVVVLLEEKLAQWKGSWELVVEKARGWLDEEAGKDNVEKVFVKARGIVMEKGAAEGAEES
jgi:hypothetical protein